MRKFLDALASKQATFVFLLTAVVLTVDWNLAGIPAYWASIALLAVPFIAIPEAAGYNDHPRVAVAGRIFGYMLAILWCSTIWRSGELLYYIITVLLAIEFIRFAVVRSPGPTKRAPNAQTT